MPAPRTPRPRVEVLEDRCVPATFTVKNLLDDGSAGTLRSALVAANLRPGADTVVFTPGLEGTLRLGGGARLDVAGPLVLKGPGAARVAIDGNGGAILNVSDADPNTLVKVTVSGLTLTNGFGDSGGAVLNVEDLTLSRCVLTGNRATTFGGAVFSRTRLALVDCTLADNRCDGSGGAVAQTLADAATTLLRTTVTGNSAVQGGGVELVLGTLLVRRSVLTNNSAEEGGGAVDARVTATSLTIEDSTVVGNTAGTSGGGVNTLAPTTLTRSQLSFNAANDGGGLRSGMDGGAVELDRCVVSGNRAEQSGGGIRLSSFGSLTLKGSTVSGNRAGLMGGGVVIGAMAQGTIRGCTVSGNVAVDSGGGLLLTTAGSVTLENTTVSGNRAGTGGGGLFVSSGPRTLTNCTIAFNRAGDAEAGGGIKTTSFVGLVNTIVAHNVAGTAPDVSGLPNNVNAEFSLIGDATGSSVTDDGGNLLGTAGAAIDPLLAPLANNGGPTQTLALKKGSPAVNAGTDVTGLPFDQRGTPFLRRRGAAVDMGAFER